METRSVAYFDAVQGAAGGGEANQRESLVICGACGAVEKPVGPHATECPNCDDYIY